MKILKYFEGEIVTLKKPHACGENRWKILKKGVDVKLQCEECGKIVSLERIEFERRIRRILLDTGKWIAIVNRE
ncbi:MAG: DUF951 domain-containing protein [Tissierellia bacterium]|nr:DUF951 domain-containing protein [Tissierellia bacterium]